MQGVTVSSHGTTPAAARHVTVTFKALVGHCRLLGTGREVLVLNLSREEVVGKHCNDVCVPT